MRLLTTTANNLNLTLSLCDVLLTLLAEVCNTLNKAEWVCRSSWQPEVDVILIKERTVYGRTIGIQASRDSLRATYDQHLWLGDRVVADVEGLGHILTNRACEHEAISVAW